MILRFLAVEEERLVNAVVSSQCAGNGGSQRNALVRRTKHGVKVLTDGLLDHSGIELAQLGGLETGLVVARVDKVRRVSAGLGNKITETQHVCAHHKLNKFLLCRSQHQKSSFLVLGYVQYNRKS